ncbi:unnamed protein product, partial [Tilletia caries]
ERMMNDLDDLFVCRRIQPRRDCLRLCGSRWFLLVNFTHLGREQSISLGLRCGHRRRNGPRIGKNDTQGMASRIPTSATEALHNCCKRSFT